MPSTDAMYGVQVTASIPVGDGINEGRISNLSLVDVPTPGILTYTSLVCDCYIFLSSSTHSSKLSGD